MDSQSAEPSSDYAAKSYSLPKKKKKKKISEKKILNINNSKIIDDGDILFKSSKNK